MRVPGDLILVLAAGLLTLVAVNLRGHHDAPAVAALPPEARALADVTLIDGFALKTPPSDPFRQIRGAAVSVSETGVWLTARQAISGCHAPMIMITAVRGLPAHVGPAGPDGVTVLTTRVGAPALALADQPVEPSGRAFHPGFPRLGPGELTSRRIDASATAGAGLDVYAETGRTEGLDGGLGGGLLSIAGTPVLDEAGRLAGLTLQEAGRHGRLRAAPLQALRDTLALARMTQGAAGEATPVTVDNYGIVADSLRRAGSVAAVVCLDPPVWPLSALR